MTTTTLTPTRVPVGSPRSGRLLGLAVRPLGHDPAQHRPHLA